MRISVSNSAGIANKYVRLLKWKIYRLNRRFKDLHYAEVFVNKEGNKNPIYEAVLRLGVPGNDIILKHRSHSPAALMAKSHQDARRYLARRSKSYRQ